MNNVAKFATNIAVYYRITKEKSYNVAKNAMI